MRLALAHRSRYVYPRPAMLGPHLVRLRPAGHARSRVERYALRVSEPGAIRWHHDAANNQVARVTWTGARLSELEVAVEMSLCLEPVNPLDFTLDLFAERTPFEYGVLGVVSLPAWETAAAPSLAQSSPCAAGWHTPAAVWQAHKFRWRTGRVDGTPLIRRLSVLSPRPSWF